MLMCTIMGVWTKVVKKEWPDVGATIYLDDRCLWSKKAAAVAPEELAGATATGSIVDKAAGLRGTLNPKPQAPSPKPQTPNPEPQALIISPQP